MYRFCLFCKLCHWMVPIMKKPPPVRVRAVLIN